MLQCTIRGIPGIHCTIMEQTIFSKIISREIPAEIVYENEHVLAFLDIRPNNPGHTLVIPKQSSVNVLDVDSAAWAEVMEAVRILAPTIRDAVHADGINIMMNNGSVAGQIVMHTHVHIIPRHTGDGYEHWHGQAYADGEMARVGANIRETLARTQHTT